MKLSISNIAWDQTHDNEMYRLLSDINIQGIEVAPSRIFPINPYEHVGEAKEFYESLQTNYKLEISSMQSIWFGRTEKLFGSDLEREVLLNYTKTAIDFAAALQCPNLVFGCPKNRVISEARDIETAYTFFYELGEYAALKGTVLALEANPVIYNTNFLNSTNEVATMVKYISSAGCGINLDLGTLIYNDEPLAVVSDNIDHINHIHISEPYLAQIEERDIHRQLASILQGKYSKFVSVEMGKMDNLQTISKILNYVKGIFYDI